MKKLVSVVMSVLMMLTFLAVPSQTAYAANATISVSSSTVNIGDSITVKVTVPEGVTATIDVSYPSDLVKFSKCSITASNSGSAISMTMGKYAPDSPMSATLTFSAKAAGTATFKATSIKAGDETGEEVTLGGGSASVTIANQASEDAPSTLSGNNLLGLLQISPGTLSPAFHPDTTNYKATVNYDVTKVSVSALAAHEKAKITSVSGGSDLQVGENTIKVVVQAENGVTKTYKIVVTRKAQETTSTEDNANTDEPDTDNTTTIEDNLSWNGSELKFVDKIPENVIPTGFSTSSIMMNNKEIPVLDFKGTLTVMYLFNESGENSLYVYDANLQDVYPFVKLETEDRFVIVLRPDDASVPAGYLSCTLSIEGKGMVSAYQFNTEELLDNTGESAKGLFGAEKYYAAEPTASDFYLIYCINDSGEQGWYQYDSVEGTFQRYSAALFASTATSNPEDQSDYNELVLELQSAKQMQMIIIVVAAVVAVILLIIIIILAVKLGKKGDDEYYDDEDEYDDEDDDISFYDEDVDDEEIEIEFYEMPVAQVKPETKTSEVPDVPDMEALLLKEAMAEKEALKEEQPKRVVTPIVVDDDDNDLEFIDLD